MTNLFIWIAPLLTLVGLAIVYWSWCQNVRQWRVLLVGWGLLGFSVWAWSRAWGPEFGAVFALFVLPLAVWLILLPQWRRGVQSGYSIISDRRKGDAVRPWAIAGRVLLLLVFSAVCCALVAVALVQLLPITHLARLVWALLLQTFLWGLLGVWLCATERLRTPVVWSIGTALVATTYLLLMA